MKKETQKIATNTSSGAEKVERIEQELKKSTRDTAKGQAKKVTRVATSTSTEKTAKGDAALGGSRAEKENKIDAKKLNAQSTNGKAEAESAAAKARVERALKKKEMKEKRKAERLAKIEKKKAERAKRAAQLKAETEKRAAQKKALVEKRAAEKKARLEKKKEEKEAKIRERARQKANKNQRKHKKRGEGSRNERKKEKKERRPREHGEKNYGGWIAAVIALGVTTLALATTVTVGAVEMNAANESAMNTHRSTMYELTGILERVENDLDRARVSDSNPQQTRILTDLLVQARLAELDVERLPVEAEADRNVTIFVNHTAMQCERMLAKLRNGEGLSAEDRGIIERLYQANHAVREELNNLVSNMSDKDLMQFVKKGDGAVKDTLNKLEQMTLEENRMVFEKCEEKKEESAQNGQGGQNEGKKIEGARAEELCARYFESYQIKEFQCVGETVTDKYSAYNVQGYDDKGNMLFAEVSQQNGTLVRFDYYEDCGGDNFDLKNAERIAEQFLEGLGYDDMEVVRCRQNGSTTDFTFVYEEDDVAYYPDEIKVKVCRTRGVVSGMDASKYLQNHKNREDADEKVAITLAQAYGKLYKDLAVESARLVVIQTARGEKTAYEMLCSYQGDKYLIYIDGMTGEEISIVNINTIR